MLRCRWEISKCIIRVKSKLKTTHAICLVKWVSGKSIKILGVVIFGDGSYVLSIFGSLSFCQGIHNLNDPSQVQHKGNTIFSIFFCHLTLSWFVEWVVFCLSWIGLLLAASKWMSKGSLKRLFSSQWTAVWLLLGLTPWLKCWQKLSVFLPLPLLWALEASRSKEVTIQSSYHTFTPIKHQEERGKNKKKGPLPLSSDHGEQSPHNSPLHLIINTQS